MVLTGAGDPVDTSGAYRLSLVDRLVPGDPDAMEGPRASADKRGPNWEGA